MISIDFAKTADLTAVQQLHHQTLGPSFAQSASSKLRLATGDDHLIHLVAREEGGVVGSIQLRRVCLGGIGCDDGQKVAFLGPLVTAAYYQGMGLGSKLIDYGLSLLQREQYHTVFLVGNENYYSRFGFRSVRPHNITLPDGHDGDRLLVIMLGRPSVLPVYARLRPYSEPDALPCDASDVLVNSLINFPVKS